MQHEKNLVALIKQLRVQHGSPNAKFITASLRQTVQGATDGGGLILDAMENVANPSTRNSRATWVCTHLLENTPGSSGGHHSGDALTYMNVGHAMGEAMVKMLEDSE